MPTTKLTAVSDLNSLIILHHSRIQPVKTEYIAGRYWAFYDPKQAQPILDQFEAGLLQVEAQSFCDSISRMKDKIFERERTERAMSGGQNATAYR